MKSHSRANLVIELCLVALLWPPQAIGRSPRTNDFATFSGMRLQEDAISEDTLDQALENRLHDWEHLVATAAGSKTVLDTVHRYLREIEKAHRIDPVSLLNARSVAHRDGDRLGEALASIFVSREYLLETSDDQDSFEDNRRDIWGLIPQSVAPREIVPSKYLALKSAHENLERAKESAKRVSNIWRRQISGGAL